MKRKGFTLVELLAVIVILAIILLLVIPSVLRSYDNSKEELFGVLVDNICTSSELYYKEAKSGLIENKMTCTTVESTEQCTITLKELQKKEYLEKTLENPLTGKEITSNSVEILVETDENARSTVKITIDEETRICE